MLDSVRVSFKGSVSTANIDDLSVKVYSAGTDGNPDAELYALVNPASVTGQSTHDASDASKAAAFAAPAGSSLLANTQYFVVVRYDNTATLVVHRADNGPGVTQPDPTAADGWSIRSKAHMEISSVWRETGDHLSPFLIQVEGVAGSALVSNVNETASSGFNFTNIANTVTELAQRFTTGNNAGGYALAAIEVGLETADDTELANWSAAVWTPDADGNPGTKQFDLTVPTSASDAYPDAGRYALVAANLTSFAAPANTTLAASTDYLLVLGDTAGMRGDLFLTASNHQIASLDDGWAIADGNRLKTTAWAANTESYDVLSMRVLGEAKPAPALVSNVNETASIDNTGIGSSAMEVAQGFTTGNNATGYALAAIEVGLRQADAMEVANWSAGVWTPDADGNPGTKLVDLTVPTSASNAYLVDMVVAAKLTSFAAPANTSLTALTDYLFVLGDTANLDGDIIGTGSDDQIAALDDGWTIADANRLKTTAWATNTNTQNALLMQVRGTAKAPSTTQTAATGQPTISGLAEVGETLTADIGGILDVNGLPDTFEYQWIRVDGASETNISGATASTHTLVAADQGKTIKVKVSFTDLLGGAESVTSEAYPTSGNVLAGCQLPTTYPGGATELWSGTVTVGQLNNVVAARIQGYASDASGLVAGGSLDDTDVDIGTTTYTIEAIAVKSSGGNTNGLGDLFFGLDGGWPSSGLNKLQVYLCGEASEYASNAHDPNALPDILIFGGWTTPLDWSGLVGRTRKVSLVSDTVAPTLLSTSASGTSVELVFNEPLDTGSVPASSAFAVTVGGTAATLATSDGVSISGSTVTLTLATATTATDSVTVAYTKPDTGNKLRDLAENDAESISAVPVASPSVHRVSIEAVHAKAAPRIAVPEFKVTIGAAQTSAVTVNLAIAQADDYLLSTSQSIVIPANRTSAAKKFPNNSYSGSTSGDLTATVVAGVGYLPAATGNAATVRFVAAQPAVLYDWTVAAHTVAEGGSVDAILSFRTAADVPKPRIVGEFAVYTFEGTADVLDYVHFSTHRNVELGDWSASGGVFTASITFTLTIKEDELYEPEGETFEVRTRVKPGNFFPPRHLPRGTRPKFRDMCHHRHHHRRRLAGGFVGRRDLRAVLRRHLRGGRDDLGHGDLQRRRDGDRHAAVRARGRLGDPAGGVRERLGQRGAGVLLHRGRGRQRRRRRRLVERRRARPERRHDQVHERRGGRAGGRLDCARRPGAARRPQGRHPAEVGFGRAGRCAADADVQ